MHLLFCVDVIGPRSVSVVYVDYGNVEKVSLALVRKLPEPLIYRLPAQASRLLSFVLFGLSVVLC